MVSVWHNSHILLASYDNILLLIYFLREASDYLQTKGLDYLSAWHIVQSAKDKLQLTSFDDVYQKAVVFSHPLKKYFVVSKRLRHWTWRRSSRTKSIQEKTYARRANPQHGSSRSAYSLSCGCFPTSSRSQLPSPNDFLSTANWLKIRRSSIPVGSKRLLRKVYWITAWRK